MIFCKKTNKIKNCFFVYCLINKIIVEKLIKFFDRFKFFRFFKFIEMITIKINEKKRTWKFKMKKIWKTWKRNKILYFWNREMMLNFLKLKFFFVEKNVLKIQFHKIELIRYEITSWKLLKIFWCFFRQRVFFIESN